MPLEHISRRLGFETARLALARVRVDTANDLREVVARATKICAEALGVERVGVWSFEDDGRALRCLAVYVRSTGLHETGELLRTRTYPTYVEALETRRVLVADDALHHPATASLAEAYLIPHGISSMLDAPVFRHGTLFAVLCHEHIGEARQWSRAEIEFASAVAEVVALVFEQAERARAEAELRETALRARELDRLVEVRRMARGVAHDFNNVLCSAIGLTGVIDGASDPAEVLAELRQVLEVGRKLAAALIRFSDPSVDTAAEARTPVIARVEQAMTALQLLVRPQARIQLSIEGDEAEVALRPLELEQLLLNLCMNARDAITGTGSIEVSLRCAERITLEVRDDGIGMTDDVKQHLFEPYFTTKPQGTGVGLSVVRELVERVGGTIEIDSRPGTGTRVRVSLPRMRP